MSLTCDRCGFKVSGPGQLTNHLGSLPCQLTASITAMAVRGYQRAHAWAPFFREAGIDVIDAPSYITQPHRGKRSLKIRPWAPKTYLDLARRQKDPTASAHEKAAWAAIKQRVAEARAAQNRFMTPTGSLIHRKADHDRHRNR